MGKLEGKVAVITGGSSGLALASARLFVEEGAHVFITGRRQEQLDEAVRTIGRNVTGVQGDMSRLDDLDRLFDTVRREKGRIDVLFRKRQGEARPCRWAGFSPAALRRDVRPECARHPVYGSEGAAFVQRRRIHHHDRIGCFCEGFPRFRRICGEQGGIAFVRTHVAEQTEEPEDPGQCAGPGGDIATPMQEQVLTKEAKEMFESLIPRGTMGQPEEIATVALFLASDDSSFVNGVELCVDGGLSAI